jgi:hypothetical protein
MGGVFVIFPGVGAVQLRRPSFAAGAPIFYPTSAPSVADGRVFATIAQKLGVHSLG